jgi:hypothetical protein
MTINKTINAIRWEIKIQIFGSKFVVISSAFIGVHEDNKKGTNNKKKKLKIKTVISFFFVFFSIIAPLIVWSNKN